MKTWKYTRTVGTCGQLVSESFKQTLENLVSVKKQMIIEYGRSTAGTAMYWKRVMKLLREYIEICAMDENILLQ